MGGDRRANRANRRRKLLARTAAIPAAMQRCAPRRSARGVQPLRPAGASPDATPSPGRRRRATPGCGDVRRSIDDTAPTLIATATGADDYILAFDGTLGLGDQLGRDRQRSARARGRRCARPDRPRDPASGCAAFGYTMHLGALAAGEPIAREGVDAVGRNASRARPCATRR